MLHSGNFNIAIEHGPVEIVSFPMNSMVDLSSCCYVNVDQAGSPPRSAPRFGWKNQELLWQITRRTKNCKAGETIQRPQFLVPRLPSPRNSQRESMVLVQDGAPQL